MGPVCAIGFFADNTAFEQPPPLGANRSRVAQELLVHGLCEAGIRGFEHV
jgi:hypothetical protein